MKQQQPKVKKGTSFNGWAVSNWGTLLPKVHRTRKKAMADTIYQMGIHAPNGTWDDCKRNHRLVKVKVTVIK